MSTSLKTYDMVIVGGGIHGAGIAQAGVAAGRMGGQPWVEVEGLQPFNPRGGVATS